MEEKEKWIGLKTTIGILFIIILILFSAAFGFKMSNIIYEKKQPKITTAYVSEKIDSVSELTTAELKYNGLVIYSKGDIPFITQKGFSMRYSANIRAGVDVSKIKIDINEDEVIVNVPNAEIQLIDIEPDSIEFYDERYALFNWTNKEDVVDAISIAEEDTTINANTEELIKRANNQTNTIIKKILTGSIGDKELIIK